jgi:hypothetical protein
MSEFRCGQDLLASNVRDAAGGAATVESDAGPLARMAPLSCASPAAAAPGADTTNEFSGSSQRAQAHWAPRRAAYREAARHLARQHPWGAGAPWVLRVARAPVATPVMDRCRGPGFGGYRAVRGAERPHPSPV